MEVVRLDPNEMDRVFTKDNLFILSSRLIDSRTYAGSNFTVNGSLIALPSDIILSRPVRLIHSYYFMNNITSVLFSSSAVELSSGVISASIDGQTITNLGIPVTITFSTTVR